MTVREFEIAILVHGRLHLSKPHLRLKDLMEWRTSEFKPEKDEMYCHIPELGVYAAFKIMP